MSQRRARSQRVKKRQRPMRSRSQSQAAINSQLADVGAAAGYALYRAVPNSPLPLKLKTTMIYGARVVLNPGAALQPGTHVFSANGLYDPDITGVGHQPRGFDQLMTLYDHYVVIGSKITAMTSAERFSDTGAFAITLKDGPTTTVDPDDILEEPYICFREGVPNGGEAVNLVQKFNNKFLGYSNPLGVTELEGNVSNNPDEQAYYHLSAWSPAGTDEPAINAIVRIEYQVMLIEPNLPGKS